METLYLAGEILNLIFSIILAASAGYWLRAECDKPLAPLLLVFGSVLSISSTLKIITMIGSEKIRRKLQPFYVRFSLLLGVTIFVWMILSNIFVFTSSNCAQTSASLVFFGSTLFGTSWWLTVLADISVGLCLLFCSNQLWMVIDNYREHLEDQAYNEASHKEESQPLV